jgi:hypothetical protein
MSTRLPIQLRFGHPPAAVAQAEVPKILLLRM